MVARLVLGVSLLQQPVHALVSPQMRGQLLGASLSRLAAGSLGGGLGGFHAPWSKLGEPVFNVRSYSFMEMPVNIKVKTDD